LKEIVQAKKKQDVDEASIMLLIQKFAIAGKTGKASAIVGSAAVPQPQAFTLAPPTLKSIISRIKEGP